VQESHGSDLEVSLLLDLAFKAALKILAVLQAAAREFPFAAIIQGEQNTRRVHNHSLD
jgi:hypothetical protein